MISFVARIVLSLILPLILWLGFGRPSLAMTGNAGLCALALALLLGMMWHDVVARAFKGDLFTYRMVSLALNAVFGLLGLLGVGVLFYWAPNGFASFGDVPGLAWAGLLVLLLISWIVPMATSNIVAALPQKDSSRREFENPTKS